MRFMNDSSFQKVVTTWIASEAYRKLRSSTASEDLPEASGARSVKGRHPEGWGFTLIAEPFAFHQFPYDLNDREVPGVRTRAIGSNFC